MSFYEAWKFTYDTFRIFQDFEISWKSISWILQDISEIFWANYQSKVEFFHKYSLHISAYSPKVYNSASRWQYHFLREFSPFLGGGRSPLPHLTTPLHDSIVVKRNLFFWGRRISSGIYIFPLIYCLTSILFYAEESVSYGSPLFITAEIKPRTPTSF